MGDGAGRKALLWLARQPWLRWQLSGPAPASIAAPPGEPWFPQAPTDGAFAEDFYTGRYRLGGHERRLRHSPFELRMGPDVPREWYEALHGFGWLRPLADENTYLARANAQAFVADWIALVGRDLQDPAWAPAIAARRLDSWLTHHDTISRGANRAVYRLYARSVGQHVRALRLMAPGAGRTDRGRIGYALALAQAATGNRTRGPLLLGEALRDLFGPDGGPVSQDPREALWWLAALRRLLRVDVERWDARDRRHVAPLDRVAERLRLWLRAVRHADGRLAQFNGTGWVPLSLVDACLGADRAAEGVRLGGYHRLVRGDAVLVADRGRGSLFRGGGGFELSVPAGRLVVSCGALGREGRLAAALRGAGAHSTFDPAGEAAAPSSESETALDEDGTAHIVTTHGALRHERWLRFDADGLAGLDRFERIDGNEDEDDEPLGVLRFHLHPAVAVRREREHALDLELRPGRAVAADWTFHCIDAVVRTQDTMLFAESPDGEGQIARQIVLDVPPPPRGEGGRQPVELRWMFVPRPPAEPEPERRRR